VLHLAMGFFRYPSQPKKSAILFDRLAKKNQKLKLRNWYLVNAREKRVRRWLLIYWSNLLIAAWNSKGPADPANHFVGAGSCSAFAFRSV